MKLANSCSLWKNLNQTGRGGGLSFTFGSRKVPAFITVQANSLYEDSLLYVQHVLYVPSIGSASLISFTCLLDWTVHRVSRYLFKHYSWLGMWLNGCLTCSRPSVQPMTQGREKTEGSNVATFNPALTRKRQEELRV